MLQGIKHIKDIVFGGNILKIGERFLKVTLIRKPQKINFCLYLFDLILQEKQNNSRNRL